MSNGRPSVPRPRVLNPLIETVPAGTAIVRIYQRRHGPIGFNPNATTGRFRPIRDSRGSIVPTSYGALSEQVAFAEALLRGVTGLKSGRPRRRVYRVEVEGLDMATVVSSRQLRLARLHGPGLMRLGLLREHVIDCPEHEYPYTAEWARALWGCRARPHGIVWTSRQNDSHQAVVLWGDRVEPAWLRPESDPTELDTDPGLDLVRRACADAEIDFDA